MIVTTVGLDLAKNVFQIHGIAYDGEVAFNRPLRRAQMLPFFQRLEPCLIGMEACGTSHRWARELTKMGHDVNLIPPMYVKPYVKRGKSDAADAEAICEAVTRPTRRFAEIKSVKQQAVLFLHRARNLIRPPENPTGQHVAQSSGRIWNRNWARNWARDKFCKGCGRW